MAKNYMVIGAGKMGRAIAFDLLRNPDTAAVTICDRDQAAVDAAKSRLGDPRVSGSVLDANDVGTTHRLMAGIDCVIGAASYELNLAMTKAAVAARAHYCDLGGNNDVVAKQFMLDAAAKNAGIRVLPDCGIAPGAVSVLGKLALDRVPNAERLQIRVGGLPQHPQGPLKYALVFSARGLVSNYVEPTEILWEGKRELVPSLGGREYQHFPTLGRLEAVYTSGGSSTLTQTYEGKLKYLDYKTLRWEGHWDTVTVLRDLGMLKESAIAADGSVLRPQEFLIQWLDATLPREQPDLLVLRVMATDGARHGVSFDLVDRMDPLTGHSAMQRTTGYSASICAQMLAYGEISATGVLKHEEAVPGQRFVEEWRKRGFALTESAITT
ncbi:MAG TPA: saccharopine dehydrogenase C-terminal domain-containing protein [Candidatus Binatia bacterium]|jgi:lysine 6-dehydrogenase|nr:saccharopine dehydrogenase C-terminal domain-containing protein [Candidatus Binatia bacterium]